ncbi:MAG: hypothetical protein MR866_02055 [Selenomonadaceae bacterium]|nr:hypothetical protein [Selenomonas bovis]MCI7330228.1 hypothetical protein [Selenomonadaceae bacterium]
MVFQDSTKPCRGDFHLAVYKGGEIIDRVDDHNLVVDAGRIRLAELAAGKSSACITKIGVGSGSTAEAADDTELEGQQLFPLTSATVDGRDARFDFLIDNSQANGLKIHEFGLFCADGTMFSHRVRTGLIEKEDDIQIKGYWILHF